MSSEQECWKRLSEFNVNRETVVALLKDENYTDDWSLEKLKSPIWREFYFWDAVIKVVEDEEELSIKGNLPITFKNFDISITSVSSFVRKIRNRMALIVKRLDVTLGYDVVFGNEIYSEVGPYCIRYGISLDWLKNPSKMKGILNFSFGLIVELRKLRVRHNFTFKDFSLWIKLMLDLDYCPDVGFLRRQMECFYKRQLALSKNSKIDQDMYLNTIYVPPKTKSNATEKNKDEGLQQKQPCLSTVDTEKCILKKNVQSLEKKLKIARHARMDANLKLNELKKSNVNLNKKYASCCVKLSNFSTRNVNKKLKRRHKKIQFLQSENIKHITEKKLLKKKSEISRQNHKQTASLLKYYRDKYRNLKKAKVTQNFTHKTCNKENIEVSSLKEKVSYLENENFILKDELEELSHSKIVTTFHEGKYTDDVREVYATLLSMNVGVKNIENVIKTVLEKLGGLKVERLPKKTFAEYMMVEAKALAQIQAAEAMLDSNFNTLHTDGTKRMGREFGGLQVGTNSGQLSLGISELVSGNTESFLKMIDQILSDMGSLLETDEDIAVKKAKLLLSVKNLMTDRHIVNTCLKNCLEKMRFECIPEDGDTPEAVRTKIAKLNGFKCNLHVIVNFASQAEIGLKQWEKNISNLDNVENNNVNFTYNQSTTDFIRACCKLCVPGADEKSGYGSLFRTFLTDNNIDLKLTTFHGHRINLLFAMGASVFFSQR
ncbi:Hypothetical predicted protein [Mytilus galloprovincialis]|uniref:Uncharacterized protein n=1 Tax=Mytilus galloprovincialis TaxID=29158 RepID=A0A8B6DA40_MYTGA|nr:Hypothetical predicted protein [Mytilus galloprovincialis]